MDDEPDGVGPRRRPADHPGRGQRGGARSRRPLLLGRRRPAHEGRHVLRGDDARRGGDRARPRRAPIRGEAGADLRAAGQLRRGPASDRRAHGGTRREHRATRRLAQGSRGRPGGRPRDDVRGRGPARAPPEAPDRWDRGRLPVRRRVHAVRRSRGNGGAHASLVRCAHETRAPPRAPVVRLAEQPARRDRAGRRRDGHVRRRARRRWRAIRRSVWSPSTRSHRGCPGKRRGRTPSSRR